MSVPNDRSEPKCRIKTCAKSEPKLLRGPNGLSEPLTHEGTLLQEREPIEGSVPNSLSEPLTIEGAVPWERAGKAVIVTRELSEPQTMRVPIQTIEPKSLTRNWTIERAVSVEGAKSV